MGFVFYSDTPHGKPDGKTPPGKPINRLLLFSLCKPQKSLCLRFCKVNGSIAHYYAKLAFIASACSWWRYKDFPPKGLNELSTLALSNFDISSWLLFFLLSR